MRNSLFDRSFDDLVELFDDVFTSSAWKDFDRVFATVPVQPFPPYNVNALKDGSILVEVAVAGYDQGNINLRTEDNRIVLEGGAGTPKSEEATCVYHGIRSSNFKLCLPIASKFDLTKIKASMKNGILKISVPLAENRKPSDVEVKIES